MYDYIIVGQGLAGSLLNYRLLENGKKTIVFDPNNSSNASRVSSGMFNAFITKRFTSIWRAQEQMILAYETIKDIEQKFTIQLLLPLPIYRIISDTNEYHAWQKKALETSIQTFINQLPAQFTHPFINSTHGFGEIKEGGRVNIMLLLDTLRNYFIQQTEYREELFDYSSLEILEDGFSYKNIQAKRIIFSEGYEVLNNPYFNYLPMEGNKGEVILIYAPQLKLEAIVKSKIFIMPWHEKDYYLVGATYNWEQKNTYPTLEAKEYIVNELQNITTIPFSIISHQAAMRPTIVDRRPLLGEHPIHKNMYILNGLGTRGILLSCDMSLMLFNYLENNIPLDQTVSIHRKNLIKNFRKAL